MEWHDASCVRVSSRASLPFGCEVFIVSNDFVPSLGGLNKWNNELGFFLFSSPSSCLIGVLYPVEGCALRLLQGGWDVSFSITLQNYCFFLTSVAWQKDNTLLLVLPQGKVYFWGSNWAEFDKKYQKNAPIPKKWWLFWITFRKNNDFFGLCSEKVWLYLKKAVTLWAKIKMIKFACYYMPYNK